MGDTLPPPPALAQQIAPAFPRHDFAPESWSPGVFSPRPVASSVLEALFARANWSASSCIKQPWTYLVASQSAPAEFARLLSCLSPVHQAWASTAPTLVLSIIDRGPLQNEETRLAALLDVGVATADLAIAGAALGLCVHQIVGILPARARELYRIPAPYEAWTVLAIGPAESIG